MIKLLKSEDMNVYWLDTYYLKINPSWVVYDSLICGMVNHSLKNIFWRLK